MWPSNNRQNRQRVPIAALGLVLVFVFLAGYYSVVTPIFEAPDELWHYLVVTDLARGQFADPNGPARQEATQPPLYYALAAVLWRLDPAPAPDAVLPLNPYFDWHVGNPTNLNFAYHGASWEQFPFAGVARTVHLLRLLSVALGALAVLGTFLLGRLVAPENPRVAYLGAGFVALLPQFLFLSGAINNDLAVVAACTWAMVIVGGEVEGGRGIEGAAVEGRMAEERDPADHVPPPSVLPRPLPRFPVPLRLLLLTIVLGLAILSKATGLGLALIVGVALFAYAPEGEDFWQRSRRAIAVVGSALLVGGWWYARLGLLYHDPLGTASREVALGRTTPFSFGEAVGDLGELGATFVARFGQTNLAPPLGVTLAYVAVAALGLAAGAYVALRAPRPARSLQLIWIGVIVVLFYVWQLSVPGPQARLVFPALASIAVVWALGADALIARLPRRTRSGTLTALGVVGLVAASAFPVLLIAPAYRPRPDRLLARLPAEARVAPASFGDAVDLLGYALPGDPNRAGPIRLFWHRGARPDAGLSFFVHAVDPTGRVVSSADATLAPSVPLDAWPDDRVVEIDVSPKPPLPPGSTLRLDLGVYHLEGKAIHPVPVGPAEASSETLAVLQPGAPVHQPGAPAVAQFGGNGSDAIDLFGWTLDADEARPGGQISGHLLWSTPRVPRISYTVFVHVLRDGKLVAQSDAPPVHGFFPTTDWTPNIEVDDRFAVSLPGNLAPGPAQIVLGLYDAATLRRLPLANGDSLTLTTIDIRG